VRGSLYSIARLIDRRTVLRTAISLGLLAFLFWRIDVGAAADAFRNANYVFVLPAVALFAVSKLLVAQRWRLMMLPYAALPLAPLWGILLVSNLANNVLPARLGDLVRVQVPATRYGVSRARGIATVFATESLLDGVAIVVLGLIGLALIDLQGFPTEVFWGLLGLVAGGLLAVIPLAHLRLSEGWTSRGVLPRLPDRPRLFIEEHLPHLIDGLGVFKHGALAAQAMALSFAIWLMEVGVVVLLGLAFDIELSMPAWMLVMITANVVSAFPIAPSNIGAYELAVAELLKALGVDAGTAGAFAIAAHMFNIAWIATAGVAAMAALRLTLHDVFSLGAPQLEGAGGDVRVVEGRL